MIQKITLAFLTGEFLHPLAHKYILKGERLENFKIRLPLQENSVTVPIPVNRHENRFSWSPCIIFKML